MEKLVFSKGDIICKNGKGFAEVIAINPMNNPGRTCIKVIDKSKEYEFNTVNDKNGLQYVNTNALDSLLRKGTEYTLNNDSDIEKEIKESLKLAGIKLNEEYDDFFDDENELDYDNETTKKRIKEKLSVLLPALSKVTGLVDDELRSYSRYKMENGLEFLAKECYYWIDLISNYLNNSTLKEASEEVPGEDLEDTEEEQEETEE